MTNFRKLIKDINLRLLLQERRLDQLERCLTDLEKQIAAALSTRGHA